jgi:glycerol kinase
MHLLFPQPGWVEIDENELWQQAQDVIKDALAGKKQMSFEIPSL